MKRLFTFGCSFTNYAWPTYADFLGNEFDYYENWGWPGLGNRAIAERIAECHARNTFTKDDTVIVQWSSHVRHDWFRTNDLSNKGWQTKGSIFNYLNADIFDRKWIETFWDENAYFMHNMNFILLAQGLLNSCKSTWRMTTITDIEKLGSDYPNIESHGENISNTSNIWESEPNFQLYKPSVFDNNKDKWICPIGLHAWKSKNKSFKFRDKQNMITKWTDYHPSCEQHSEWLISKLLPSLGLSQNLSNKSLEWIDTINDIYDNSRYDFETFCENINYNLKDWKTSYRGF